VLQSKDVVQNVGKIPGNSFFIPQILVHKNLDKSNIDRSTRSLLYDST